MSYTTSNLNYPTDEQLILPPKSDLRKQYNIEPIPLYEPADIDGIRISPSSPAASPEALRIRANENDFLSRPWLPPKVKNLLQRLRRGRISEPKLIELMEIVADRVIEHFDLPDGKFAAITVTGKIVEITDNKLDLLRRIQGVNYPELVFLWKVGSASFSGRI